MDRRDARSRLQIALVAAATIEIDHDHEVEQDHDHDKADASASEDLDAAVADGADASSSPTKPGKYVLSVIVFGPEITNTYVTLVDSLGVKDVDLKKGIEFAGQANVAADGGGLYISDGESPVITRSLDLKTQEAKPIDGIDRMGAQQTVFTIDGRTFLFAPNQDFDLTKIYEVKPDGTSSVAFEIEGWSRAFLKLK